MTLITFSKMDLLYALSELSNVIPKKAANYPVCKFIAVTFKDDTIIFTGSNTLIQISIKVAGKFIKKPDNFLFHFDKVYAIAKLCKESRNISFDLQNSNQIIVVPDHINAKYQTNTMAYDEYVWLQSEKLDHKTTLPCSSVFESLTKISHATTNDQNAKAILKGIHVNVSSTDVSAVTTDGHRLASFKSELEAKQDLNNKVVIPVDAGNMIAKICANHQDHEITLGFNKTTFKAVVDNIQVVFRLQSAIYPELDKTIPSKTAYTVEINRQDLIDALTTLAPIALDDNFKRCTFDITPNTITLKADNHMKEAGEVELEVSGSTVDMTINLNHTFVMDAVTALSCETLFMGFSAPLKAVIISDGINSKHLNVIMPLR